VLIRAACEADQEAIWRIFHLVVAGRDTYTFLPDTPREVGVGYWFGPGVTCYVAELDGNVVGMYKLIANACGLGSHVSNASFMVHPSTSGRGVGRALVDHCLREARRQGYDAMQFNFVVSTNVAAVSLWQRVGFRIIGTIPRAFQHATHGLVDAFIMHRFLDDLVITFGAERLVGPAAVRHCAYAVIATPDPGEPRRIALVRTGGGVLLPGGALEQEEDHVEAMIREVCEECSWQVSMKQPLGDAVQIVGGRSGRPLVEKRGRFFTAAIDAAVDKPADHEVMWVMVDEALDAATNDSHRWAIRRWARLNT
jgi:ribosomal protein S18 acetylase RimI-like enzyme/8-oxo-dGTP pyrophosphatase MutT (NUDIX family)